VQYSNDEIASPPKADRNDGNYARNDEKKKMLNNEQE
jgi:hypothetical protein